MISRRLALLALLAAPLAAESAGDAPLFEAVIGPNGPLAGEDENAALFPVGGAPASFAVDADGQWWVLDAIGGRVVVFERSGRVARTIAFPLPARGARASFRSDLETDGAGGVFVLDEGSRRVERWNEKGARIATFGSEKLPRGQGAIDLPRRISRAGDTLFVADLGSERLLRFSLDGEFRGVAGRDFELALTHGARMGLVPDAPEGSALLVVNDEAPVPLPIPEVKSLFGATAIGVTKTGELVVAFEEGGRDAADRVRVARVDARGQVKGELLLPVPRDEATPVRRWRLTGSGTLAWFRVKDGRFQAFETPLP